MELDSSIFGDELFSVDLENIDIPSLPLHFQIPGTDLADEADKSDMGVVALSVIDPHFVKESNIDEFVKDAVGQVDPGATTTNQFSDCLSSFDVAKHYASLHILVCGFCHSVFHVIDEFRSHTTCCSGVVETPPYGSSVATPGLAIVLWTNAVLRLVRRRLGLADPDALVRRIESRWFRLSRKTKLGWEKAAEVLLETDRVGRSLFASAMEKDISSTERFPGDQWPGPLDFRDADEIHGSECCDQVKLEAEVESHPSSLNLETTKPKVEEYTLTDPKPGVDEEVFKGSGRPSGVNPAKRLGYVNLARNKKGRWEAPKVECRTFLCEECQFKAATEWKLKRHMKSSKHKGKLDNGTQVMTPPLSVVTSYQSPEHTTELNDCHNQEEQSNNNENSEDNNNRDIKDCIDTTTEILDTSYS